MPNKRSRKRATAKSLTNTNWNAGVTAGYMAYAIETTALQGVINGSG
jgi:hypothetical protein